MVELLVAAEQRGPDDVEEVVERVDLGDPGAAFVARATRVCSVQMIGVMKNSNCTMLPSSGEMSR